MIGRSIIHHNHLSDGWQVTEHKRQRCFFIEGGNDDVDPIQGDRPILLDGVGMVHDPKSRATRCDNNYFTAASFVTLANFRAVG